MQLAKIRFLDFFFCIAAEGGDISRVRLCASHLVGQGEEGRGFAHQLGISGASQDKKHISLVFGFWDLSSKHIALHIPFKVAQTLSWFLNRFLRDKFLFKLWWQ